MQAFFKSVPIILVVVDHLQMVECTGFVKEDFPLFVICWRGLMFRNQLHHISYCG